MTESLHPLIAAIATVTACAFIFWGWRYCFREAEFRCRWCGQLCDRHGLPSQGEPLVVRDGFCKACFCGGCREDRQLVEARIIHHDTQETHP